MCAPVKVSRQFYIVDVNQCKVSRQFDIVDVNQCKVSSFILLMLINVR